MVRRTFVKTVAGTLAAPAAAPLSAEGKPDAAGGEGAKGRPPNVVIMICGDLGSGDLHCYGASLKISNLKRLAAEEVADPPNIQLKIPLLPAKSTAMRGG